LGPMTLSSFAMLSERDTEMVFQFDCAHRMPKSSQALQKISRMSSDVLLNW